MVKSVPCLLPQYIAIVGTFLLLLLPQISIGVTQVEDQKNQDKIKKSQEDYLNECENNDVMVDQGGNEVIVSELNCGNALFGKAATGLAYSWVPSVHHPRNVKKAIYWWEAVVSAARKDDLYQKNNNVQSFYSESISHLISVYTGCEHNCPSSDENALKIDIVPKELLSADKAETWAHIDGRIPEEIEEVEIKDARSMEARHQTLREWWEQIHQH